MENLLLTLFGKTWKTSIVVNQKCGPITRDLGGGSISGAIRTPQLSDCQSDKHLSNDQTMEEPRYFFYSIPSEVSVFRALFEEGLVPSQVSVPPWSAPK